LPGYCREKSTEIQRTHHPHIATDCFFRDLAVG